MNLLQATQAMQGGAKVKLPEFIGYWYMDGTIIKVLTRAGDVLETPWLEKYRDRTDFEVTDGNLQFDFAFNALMSGKAVRRKHWTEGAYIKMQTPDKSSKMTLPYIYAKTGSGDYIPCQVKNQDILAHDWEVYHFPAEQVAFAPQQMEKSASM